jgi:hypothetical protein
MGDFVEAMLAGDFCSQCGEYIDDCGNGIPRTCGSCEADEIIPLSLPTKQKRTTMKRKWRR